MTVPRRIAALDALRLFLTVGFRVGRSNGPDAVLERDDGCILYVPKDGDVSEAAFAALLDAARIEPAHATALLSKDPLRAQLEGAFGPCGLRPSISSSDGTP